MKALRFLHSLARLGIGMALIAIGVLTIIDVDVALPAWSWSIPAAALMAFLALMAIGRIGHRRSPQTS